MTELPLPLKILADDRNKIMYRPSFAKITGSVLGAILLQQVLFRFDNNGGQKFYKFMQPCKHVKYINGDSWTEELGFSRYELAAALKAIATKSTAGANKTELMSVTSPVFDIKGVLTNAVNLVIYWTDSSRVTWFWLNANLLGNAVVQHYLGNSDVQNYLVIPQSNITYEKLDSSITFKTENTPNTTTDINTSTAPKGAGKPSTPRKKSVSPYTPEENKAIGDLLKAWQETAQNIQPFAYKNKTFRESAYQLHKLGITPELVGVYVANMRMDRYWRDKAINWNKVCSEIIPFLKARNRLPNPPKPANEIVDDPQPKTPSAFQSFGAKKEVA